MSRVVSLLGRVLPARRGPRTAAPTHRGAHVITALPPRPHRDPDPWASELLVPWTPAPTGRHRREAP